MDLLWKTWLTVDAAVYLPQPYFEEFSDGGRVDVATFVSRAAMLTSRDQPPILVTVLCGAVSVAEASDRARRIATNVMNKLAVAATAYVEEPTLLLTVSLEPGTQPRTLARFFPRVEASVYPMRDIDHAKLRWLHDGLQQSDEVDRPRLERAMHLFRKSFQEEDALDRFEDLWNALETLNPILIRRHSLPTAFPGKRCLKCNEQVMVPGSSAGIRYAIGVIAGRAGEWKSIYDLRQAIAHGKGSLRDAYDRATSLIPVLHEALAATMEHLFEVSAPHLALRRLPLRRPRPVRAMASITLHDTAVGRETTLEALPSLDLRIIPAPPEPLTDGTQGYAIAMNHTLSVGGAARWSDEQIRLIIPKDPDLPDEAYTRPPADGGMEHPAVTNAPSGA